MIKIFNIILTCIFIGVGIFSFTKVISLYKDNQSLNQQIRDVLKPQIVKLENENVKVNSELTKVSNSLLASEEENRVIKEELVSKREELDQANTQLEEKDKILAQLANQYDDLNNENNLFKQKFDAMVVEFTEMKKTLSSVDALKKIISDLKAGAKKNKRKAPAAKKTKINKENSKTEQNIVRKIDNGNEGYLVRDGQSTYEPRVRIRVLNVE